MKKVLVIIPAYNEEKNILKTVNKIKTLSINNIDLDYIVINDGSCDNTLDVLIKNNLNYINLINNLGIGGAVQTGYKLAMKHNYDIAVQFDGDGQHDEKYIEKLIKPIIDEKCNFVIGSRFVGNESDFKSSTIRRFGINFLSWLIKKFSGQAIKDVTSGFRAIDKDIINLFAKDYPTDYPEPETNLIVLKKRYKVKEIPVKMYRRESGKSSISPLKSAFYMFKVSFAILIASLINRKGEK